MNEKAVVFHFIIHHYAFVGSLLISVPGRFPHGVELVHDDRADVPLGRRGAAGPKLPAAETGELEVSVYPDVIDPPCDRRGQGHARAAVRARARARDRAGSADLRLRVGVQADVDLRDAAGAPALRVVEIEVQAEAGAGAPPGGGTKRRAR